MPLFTCTLRQFVIHRIDGLEGLIAQTRHIDVTHRVGGLEDRINNFDYDNFVIHRIDGFSIFILK